MTDTNEIFNLKEIEAKLLEFTQPEARVQVRLFGKHAHMAYAGELFHLSDGDWMVCREGSPEFWFTIQAVRSVKQDLSGALAINIVSI